MSNIAIQIDNLSKRYIIDHQKQGGYRTLSDQLASSARSVKKLLLHGKRTQNPHREEFWALKNVSFEIKQGDRVGIIGRNGAGKSTLLKILSRITEPTQGKVAIKGRVASLLEVGTGFHPELTGRENIYLNGAILGMSRIEIRRKFDEIVAFAEVEKFLDTPVKRYSSGMYVRLAFAVAAHLEPEVLIIDEVLAVGDADFQKKCLGKMQDISEDQGRTIIFVSHNSEAVQRLCSTCILFERGSLIAQGDTQHVMTRYLARGSQRATPRQWIGLENASRIGTNKVSFRAVSYSSLRPSTGFNAYSEGPLEFHLLIDSDSSRSIGSLAVVIYDQAGNKLVNADTLTLGQKIFLQEGQNTVQLRINRLHLNPGIYILGFWVADPFTGTVFDFIETAVEFEVVSSGTESFGVRPSCDGLVTCDFELLPSENIQPFNVQK